MRRTTTATLLPPCTQVHIHLYIQYACCFKLKVHSFCAVSYINKICAHWLLLINAGDVRVRVRFVCVIDGIAHVSRVASGSAATAALAAGATAGTAAATAAPGTAVPAAAPLTQAYDASKVVHSAGI
jgi:hypothetical protein